MKLDNLQKLAITVYFELLLVAPELKAQYIETEFPTEEIFWETLQTTNVELPYLVE